MRWWPAAFMAILWVGLGCVDAAAKPAPSPTHLHIAVPLYVTYLVVGTLEPFFT